MPSDAPQLPPQPADGAFARFFQWWHHTPLYLRILGGVVLGVGVGIVIPAVVPPIVNSVLPPIVHPETKDAADKPDGAEPSDSVEKDKDAKSEANEAPAPKLSRGQIWARQILFALETPSKLILRLLGALASPLILLAVIQALMHAQLPKGSALRLVFLLALNTLVAIGIGLAVANVIRPGKWTNVELPPEPAKKVAEKNPIDLFLENVPKSVLGPLSDEGKVISVIMIAVAFGIALRRLKDHKVATVADVVDVGFRALITILHWIIEVIPLAVFGIVAGIIGREGFGAFVNLGGFVVAVLIALTLQATYYIVRIHFGCWASPLFVLRGMRDALVMAFSTASSTATMPVTYACLRQKVGLRERSASLGALVGANFNNDGTALYEAMAALFVAQMVGLNLSWQQQVMLVLTSVVASVGAAGIPEAGLVTMTLVFHAVGLKDHTGFIAVLLTVDWFLDRCRTTVNVLGDVNVSCMLDGREREAQHVEPAAEELDDLVDGDQQPEMVGPTELIEPPAEK